MWQTLWCESMKLNLNDRQIGKLLLYHSIDMHFAEFGSSEGHCHVNHMIFCRTPTALKFQLFEVSSLIMRLMTLFAEQSEFQDTVSLQMGSNAYLDISASWLAPQIMQHHRTGKTPWGSAWNVPLQHANRENYLGNQDPAIWFLTVSWWKLYTNEDDSCAKNSIPHL